MAFLLPEALALASCFFADFNAFLLLAISFLAFLVCFFASFFAFFATFLTLEPFELFDLFTALTALRRALVAFFACAAPRTRPTPIPRDAQRVLLIHIS